MIKRRGQSIIELVVAMAIGLILVMGGVSTIVPMLNVSSNVAKIQTASALGKELLDNARVVANANWHAISSLATSSSNSYYVIASTSPFTVTSGVESVVISTTTYTRFFYLDDVHRGATSPFEPGSGSTYDPSTRKITVVYSWPPNASNTITSYITRARDEIMFDNDWTGGPNQDGPVTATSTNTRFSSSSNIDYTGTAGSIVITGF